MSPLHADPPPRGLAQGRRELRDDNLLKHYGRKGKDITSGAFYSRKCRRFRVVPRLHGHVVGLVIARGNESCALHKCASKRLLKGGTQKGESTVQEQRPFALHQSIVFMYSVLRFPKVFAKNMLIRAALFSRPRAGTPPNTA
jgi:hypothetical protein